jgi:hypothetical protein
VSAPTICSEAIEGPFAESGTTMTPNDDRQREGLPELPEHLQRWPGLWVREGDRIADAPARDAAVARSYPRYRDKGPVAGGKRITILTEDETHLVGDEVRVVHVVEFVEPGHQAYVMGPKPVFGEFIDDELVTEPVPAGDPLVPAEYNGVTLPSPAVDYNFEITTYTFHEPGIYWIQWRLGQLVSNTLEVIVESLPAA